MNFYGTQFFLHVSTIIRAFNAQSFNFLSPLWELYLTLAHRALFYFFTRKWTIIIACPLQNYADFVVITWPNTTALSQNIKRRSSNVFISMCRRILKKSIQKAFVISANLIWTMCSNETVLFQINSLSGPFTHQNVWLVF